MVGRSGVFDAILREELAVLIAGDEVELIVLVVTGLIGFLNATARRRIVAGDGESDERMVVELYLLLHQTLAERATADDGGTIVVLHSSGKDFSCRGRSFVDEHHQRYLLIAAVTI